jgi:hypothetical protein
MLELPPAAAEELARKRAEQMADLPFVFEIYAQSISLNMTDFVEAGSEERIEGFKKALAVAIEAVRVLKEGYM